MANWHRISRRNGGSGGRVCEVHGNLISTRDETCWLCQREEARTGICMALEREVEAFLDDPITDFYGVGSEMMPLVIANHRKRHGCRKGDY